MSNIRENNRRTNALVVFEADVSVEWSCCRQPGFAHFVSYAVAVFAISLACQA
jgi:hypothetical protein